MIKWIIKEKYKILEKNILYSPKLLSHFDLRLQDLRSDIGAPYTITACQIRHF
jgi:hypothetical protein